jgi:hypothetical protein
LSCICFAVCLGWAPECLPSRRWDWTGQRFLIIGLEPGTEEEEARSRADFFKAFPLGCVLALERGNIAGPRRMEWYGDWRR